MLDRIEAVIFDLDGTLVDSMWMWRDIDIEFLGRYGISLPEDLQASIAGMSFSETAVYFKERFQIAESVEHIKASWNEMAYHKYANEVRSKEYVIEFLKMLKERKIKTGIATSNSMELAKLVIESNGLDHYFDAVHTSCEVNKGKPEPDIFLHVAKNLGVNPCNCLVFEDIPEGIMAGKRAGMKVCAVEDEFSMPLIEEKKMLADYYITGYKELLNE